MGPLTSAHAVQEAVTKLCTVIQLDERKIFNGSTVCPALANFYFYTNADARVCGSKPFCFYLRRLKVSLIIKTRLEDSDYSSTPRSGGNRNNRGDTPSPFSPPLPSPPPLISRPLHFPSPPLPFFPSPPLPFFPSPPSLPLPP